jgi:hypothetical protein
MLNRHRLAAETSRPATESTRPTELDGAKRGANGILTGSTPALDPPEHATPINKTAIIVKSKPVQNETRLFIGISPGLAGIWPIRLT